MKPVARTLLFLAAVTVANTVIVLLVWHLTAPPAPRTVLCVVINDVYESPFIGVGIFHNRELICRLK